MAEKLKPLIKTEAGLTIAPFRVACGWPARSGLARKNRRVGECWVHGSVREGKRDIFISPLVDDSVEAAHILLHELLHAALPPGAGHRKPFAQAAKAVGLEGKPTSTVAGDALRARLRAIVDELGPYPHDSVAYDFGPRETTRMLKVMCPICGYITRITNKWLEEAGAPICPQCAVQMVQAGPDDEPADPLFVIEQQCEYKVKGHGDRFRIRMNRSSKRTRWWILDYEPWESQGGAKPLVFEQPTARLTPAEHRYAAIELIESLTEGLLTYPDLDYNDEVEDLAEEEIDLLGDDEDEIPDNEDGYLNPEEEEALALEQAKREAWVQIEDES